MSVEYFGELHQQVRRSVRLFVEREMTPQVDAWEESGSIPRELHLKAAEAGLLGVGYPEEWGGSGGDLFLQIAVTEELMRCGSAGACVALQGSLSIALPPILSHGSEVQKARFVPPVLAGEKIAALAISEPGCGSDVGALTTRAVLSGDHYLVSGSKTFISSGCRADQLTCAVRTGGEGPEGISLLVIPSDTPGYSTSQPLRKMGWWASDTAQIFFDQCPVPVSHLIGAENAGFKVIMANFQFERLLLSVMANSTAALALQLATQYAREREAFGRRVGEFQVTRHKLVDMATELEVSREFTYRVAARMSAGQDQITEVSMAKNFACSMCDRVTHAAVQIFGGYGCMREYPVERLYRDSRILSIGGGTTEVMKEIIARRILS